MQMLCDLVAVSITFANIEVHAKIRIVWPQFHHHDNANTWRSSSICVAMDNHLNH